MCVFVEKVTAKKQTEKKVPPKVKQRTMVVAQGSQTARPKVKDCLNKKQLLNNKQQQFNNSAKIPTIAESLIQFDCGCLCFLFDFKFKGHDLTRPGQGPANIYIYIYIYTCTHMGVDV